MRQDNTKELSSLALEVLKYMDAQDIVLDFDDPDSMIAVARSFGTDLPSLVSAGRELASARLIKTLADHDKRIHRGITDAGRQYLLDTARPAAPPTPVRVWWNPSTWFHGAPRGPR